MAHKYTYPVVDRALRNFLMFVLVLIAVVAVATAVGTSFDIIDLPMGYIYDDYSPMSVVFSWYQFY